MPKYNNISTFLYLRVNSLRFTVKYGEECGICRILADCQTVAFTFTYAQHTLLLRKCTKGGFLIQASRKY